MHWFSEWQSSILNEINMIHCVHCRFIVDLMPVHLIPVFIYTQLAIS